MNFYDVIIRTPSYSMSSYVPFHILNYARPFHHYFMTLSLGHHHIPCHHMCHATSSTMPCHAITSLVFHWVCPAIISIGYSFVIHEHLWHQWQLYTQHTSMHKQHKVKFRIVLIWINLICNKIKHNFHLFQI